jgi:hypothetical protein
MRITIVALIALLALVAQAGPDEEGLSARALEICKHWNGPRDLQARG